MGRLKLKGDDVDSKLKHVEKILYHHSKRLGKKVIEKISAIPISGYKDIAGPEDYILYYLIPFNCKIKKAFTYIKSKPEEVKELTIIIRIEDGFNSNLYKINLNSKTNSGNVDIDLDIKAGTIIQGYVKTHTVNNIAISLSILPVEFSKKEHIINQLLEIEEI